MKKAASVPRTIVTRSPLQRGISLLRFVAEQNGRGARVGEIADHLAIHRVNAHRLIKSLLSLGLIEQGADLSYHLGYETWNLGLAASQYLVPRPVTDAIARISNATEESVFAMRRAGDEGVCIAAHEGPLPIRFMDMHVGSRRILGIGGVSSALLLALSPDESASVIARNSSRYPEFGISASKVEDFVRRARRLGYSYSEGVVVPEVRTIAVPVPLSKSQNKTGIAIGILTTESRAKPTRRAELAQLLIKEAKKMSSLFR